MAFNLFWTTYIMDIKNLIKDKYIKLNYAHVIYELIDVKNLITIFLIYVIALLTYSCGNVYTVLRFK